MRAAFFVWYWAVLNLACHSDTKVQLFLLFVLNQRLGKLKATYSLPGGVSRVPPQAITTYCLSSTA